MTKNIEFTKIEDCTSVLMCGGFMFKKLPYDKGQEILSEARNNGDDINLKVTYKNGESRLMRVK